MRFPAACNENNVNMTLAVKSEQKITLMTDSKAQ